jgi:flagellar hook-associated protein 1 FlgK
LNADGASYRTIVTSVLASFQQDASNISSLTDTAVEQAAYLKEKLANKTGVNTDEEMVLLVTLQQAYTASARVMTVTNELFDVLSNI